MSNFYIFRYAVIMVVLVAAILSSVAMLLKPFQDENIRIDKMKGILASANIEASAENAIQLYGENIVEEMLISNKGEVIEVIKKGDAEPGQSKAFKLNLKKELYKKSKGEDFNIPLLVAETNGKRTYIIPLLGTGLWGPVWGNIALEEDFNTVVGVTFGHKGETPGLGAEIDTKNFQVQFVGKEIFKNGEFISVKVVKGGIITMPTDMQIHGVDAISGGTITSDAVSEMIANCLENYVPFIKNQN